MMKSERDRRMHEAARKPLVRVYMAEEESGYVYAPLLSVSEAAKELGVGKKIIYQLIENGEIRVVKATGGAVLVEKKSLDEFRAAGRLP